MPTELELLCRWLNSGNNKKESELNFTAYYNSIGKKLLPYLENKLSLTGTGLAEEIFQEIMVNIFKLIIDRPQAAKHIEELTKELETIDFNNPFFKKRTNTWTKDVRNWAEEAIIFHLEHSQIKSPELDDKVKSLNNKMKPLEKEGEALSDWLVDNKKNTHEEDEFIEKTNELIKTKPKLLSKIRIPTSALLYKMAKNKGNDHWRKKSTQTETSFELDWDSKDENTHGSMTEEADYQGYLEWVRQQNQGITKEAGNMQEAIEFLLQAPIRKAENELEKVTDKQAIQRCENRLDKARINYIKHLETLEMMKAEYTQEKIAVNLALTRDQVRTLQAQIKVLLEPLKGDLL